MARPFLRSAFKRLPPVARRDERIAHLSSELSRLRKSNKKMRRQLARVQSDPVVRPSYHAKLHSEQRLTELGRVGTSAIIDQGKVWARDFARSHGVDTPRELARWNHPRDIAWDDLPDLVVIKADHGSASRGVLPLRRHDGDWQVITHDDVVTAAQISAQLAARVDEELARGPFIAEEFLDEDGSGTRPPMDLKVYTFYGEAPLVLLRRADRHGVGASVRFRVVDRDGRDAVETYARKTVDKTLELPDAFEEALHVAERLSIPIRAPFMRIDLYAVRDRVIFGETTPRPGADLRHLMPPELDTSLGEAWERAEARLAADVADGASPVPEFGPVPITTSEESRR